MLAILAYFKSIYLNCIKIKKWWIYLSYIAIKIEKNSIYYNKIIVSIKLTSINWTIYIFTYLWSTIMDIEFN